MTHGFPFGRVLFWGCMAAGVSGLQYVGAEDTGVAANSEQSVLYVAPDNAAMTKAREQARRELPTFLKIASVDPVGWELASLKVGIASSETVEHIWISEFTRVQGSTYQGYLANTPKHLPKLDQGDMVTFTFDQIDDFAFIEDGKGYGFYSLRAMLPQMTPQQARATGGFLSKDPLPGYW